MRLAVAVYVIEVIVLLTRIQSPSEIGQAFGYAFGLVLVAFMVGWLVWRVSKRNLTAGNIVFLGVLGLLVAREVSVFANFEARDHSIETQRTQSLDSVRSIFNEMDAVAHSDSAQESTERRAVAASNAIEQEFGSNEIIAGIFHAIVNSTIEQEKAWAATYDSFSRTNILDFKTIDSIQELRRRQEIVENYRKASMSLATLFADSESLMDSILMEIDVNDDWKREFKAGFSKTYLANARFTITLYRSHSDFASATSNVLEVLKENWGSWEWSSEHSTVVFETDYAVEKYNTAYQRLKERAEALLDAERQWEEAREDFLQNGVNSNLFSAEESAIR